MKQQTIIYNNNINNEDRSNFIRKQYFAIPVLPIKVALKSDIKPQYNHFERAVLSLLITGKRYTNIEIAELLMIDNELVDLIINTLIAKGDLDDNKHVTDKAEEILKGIYRESITEVQYAFYDINRNVLLEETIDSNALTFTQVWFDDYSDFTKNDIKDYYHSVVIKADSNDERIDFSVVETNNKLSVNEKLIEAFLKTKNIYSRDNDSKVLISANIIEFSSKKHYLLSYVDTSINSANSNRWNVRNPLSLLGDLELNNFFYYNNSNKIISLIIEKLMKNRVGIINETIDKKQLYYFIKRELFNKAIDDKHEIFIEPLIYVLDSICIQNSNMSGQSGNMQLQESIKMAMIYFGQLYESLLYQSAIESKQYLKDVINVLSNNREYNNSTLQYMAEVLGFDLGDGNISLFNTTNHDLDQMFSLGREYVLSACISINIIIGNRDDEFFINKLAKKHKDAIVKINKLKLIRDSKRHTTDKCYISVKDYLDIAFDIMELAFNYSVNKERLNDYFASKVSLYDYSYSNEYLRNKLGTEFFDSDVPTIINIKNSLIEMHKKYLEKQSDYLASAHSVIEDLFREMLITILNKRKLDISLKIRDYFSKAEELENYVNLLGFNTNIDQALFKTHIQKALVIDDKTDFFIQNGFKNNFSKSTNRVKMQSLIMLFKYDSTLANDYLSEQNGLKDLFKLTTIVMYLDRSHKQNNIFNEEQARYVVENIIMLVKNIFNNKTVINWRNE